MPARKEFLLITMGSAGDVYPFIGLAQRLIKSGFAARIVTHVRYLPVVEQAGINCIPFGDEDDFDKLGENPLIWHPFKAFDFIISEAIRPGIEPLWEILCQFDPQKTVLVSTVLCFAARMAQEKMGFPLVTAVLQPSLFTSAIEPPVLHPTLKLPRWLPLLLRKAAVDLVQGIVLDSKFLPWFNQVRAEKGLPPVSRIMQRWIHSPDKVLCLFPQWFAPVQQDWPPNTVTSDFLTWDRGVTDDNYREAKAFIDEGGPVVLFTPGSEMLQGRRFFQESLAAVNQLGIRGIFVTKRADQLPAQLPATVKTFPYLSFSKVFPLVDAVVFHGGVGTLAKTFRAGVPQLIMPMAFDQPDNAARAKRLGTGDFLVPRRFKGTRIAARLKRLLESPAVKENCIRIKHLSTASSKEDASLNILVSLVENK